MKSFWCLFQKDCLPKTRIESLSDGVFSIILTLLILEIRLPPLEYSSDQTLMLGLLSLGPQILSWVCSFLIVAVFWVNHHFIIHSAQKADFGLIWINTFFLLAISFAPFPTGLLGKYPHSPFVITFFSLTMMIAGAIIIGMRGYVTQYLGGPKNRPHTLKSLFFGPGFYLMAAGISWINIYLAYTLLLFIPLYFMIPRTEDRPPS